MQESKIERNQFKEDFRDMKPTQSTVKDVNAIVLNK